MDDWERKLDESPKGQLVLVIVSVLLLLGICAMVGAGMYLMQLSPTW